MLVILLPSGAQEGSKGTRRRRVAGPGEWGGERTTQVAELQVVLGDCPVAVIILL